MQNYVSDVEHHCLRLRSRQQKHVLDHGYRYGQQDGCHYEHHQCGRHHDVQQVLHHDQSGLRYVGRRVSMVFYQKLRYRQSYG
jgi:hypothetical protein